MDKKTEHFAPVDSPSDSYASKATQKDFQKIAWERRHCITDDCRYSKENLWVKNWTVPSTASRCTFPYEPSVGRKPVWCGLFTSHVDTSCQNISLYSVICLLTIEGLVKTWPGLSMAIKDFLPPTWQKSIEWINLLHIVPHALSSLLPTGSSRFLFDLAASWCALGFEKSVISPGRHYLGPHLFYFVSVRYSTLRERVVPLISNQCPLFERKRWSVQHSSTLE